MSTNYEALANTGLSALRRGDAAAARAAFQQVEAAGRGTHQLRLLLAQACAATGDGPGAHRALDKVLAEEPGNPYALILRGDLLVAGGDKRAAVSWYRAALAVAPGLGSLPPDLQASLRRAEATLAASAAEFQAHLDAQLAAAGVGQDGAGPHFAEALDILAGRAQPQLQQPTSFYYPGLPQRAFFEREEFAWVPAMEAAAPAIRAELEVFLAGQSGIGPYVVADEDRAAKRHPLMGDTRWSAIHLYRGGLPVAGNADRCPATMAALQAAPIPWIDGRSPMALFSVLHPGTHIPPHNGMLNTRLICHLPLIVPPGSRLRVGNHTRAVEPGRMMIFDDSIEHEAWNDGSATRVVLLFEIWRPELDARERGALTTLYEAIGVYAPLGEDQAGA